MPRERDVSGLKITWQILVCLALLANCAGQNVVVPARPGPIGDPAGPFREQLHWIPAGDILDPARLLYARVCRPTGEQPARIVVIAHGTPADPTRRPSMMPIACDHETIQWFMARGFVAVAGIRRGYGLTGGRWVETTGRCSAAEFVAAAREGAHDLDATVRYARNLPYARADGVVVVGQSAGGWAALGYNSVPHPHVVAMVSMAGGRGGRVGNIPHTNCRPEELVRAASTLGATATTPMLWIYTENDTFFSPRLARAMHDAFRHSGASARLFQLGPFREDGHSLFFGPGGSAIWGPLVADYLVGRSELGPSTHPSMKATEQAGRQSWERLE